MNIWHVIVTVIIAVKFISNNHRVWNRKKDKIEQNIKNNNSITTGDDEKQTPSKLVRLSIFKRISLLCLLSHVSACVRRVAISSNYFQKRATFQRIGTWNVMHRYFITTSYTKTPTIILNQFLFFMLMALQCLNALSLRLLSCQRHTFHDKYGTIKTWMP